MVPDAAWHLFLADESGLPATFAMLGALAPGARALACFEVGGPGEVRPPPGPAGAAAEVHWLERDGAAPGTSRVLTEAAATVTLPEGRGHAYLAAEIGVVAAARQALATRGLTAGQLSAKPYWRLGVANAANGP